MADYCFVQDNQRPYFAVQLLKVADNMPVVLTGATVTLYFKNIANPNAKVAGGACVITDAINGLVEYRWAATDLSDPGEYTAEFRCNFAGVIQSVIIEGVIVQEKLG